VFKPFILPLPEDKGIPPAATKGMSRRQIAAQQGVALGTVKTRLQLAQRKLYNYLLPLQQNKI
jgi:hypothetical protein